MADRTPAAWLEVLEKRLHERWNRLKIYDAYYEGDHELAFATQKWRNAFGAQFSQLADNWMQIVVDSSVERLNVQGFRFGASQEADADAWAIWQANNLDAQAQMAHTEAVKLSEAYWLVAPGESKDDPPIITAEHPSQFIVAHVPGNRRQRLAALKKWVGEDSYAYATLYLPSHIFKWQSQRPINRLSGTRIDWQRRRGDEGGPNPLGVVPGIPIPNNPSLLRGGRSDLAGGPIHIQNAVNKLLSDMLIGSEYQAYPQRVLLGVEPPRDENGRPIPAAELKASQERVWFFRNENAKVAEFKAADLENFGKSMDRLVKHLTAQTKTPPHYVLGEVVNASGDALKAAETGLVSKTKGKMPAFGDSHEEAMRLSFMAMGDKERAQEIQVETIWRDPESRSFGELVDGLVKLSTIGVPHEILWERAGFSPQEIDRMRSMQAADLFLGGVDDGGEQPVPTDN